MKQEVGGGEVGVHLNLFCTTSEITSMSVLYRLLLNCSVSSAEHLIVHYNVYAYLKKPVRVEPNRCTHNINGKKTEEAIVLTNKTT